MLLKTDSSRSTMEVIPLVNAIRSSFVLNSILLLIAKSYTSMDKLFNEPNNCWFTYSLNECIDFCILDVDLNPIALDTLSLDNSAIGLVSLIKIVSFVSLLLEFGMKFRISILIVE